MRTLSDMKERDATHQQGEMVIHDRGEDMKGVGKRDAKTGRYIPISGGSRTRIPVSDDGRVPRYVGNVGVDASLSEHIDAMPALYRTLGGLPIVRADAKQSKFVGLVAERKPEEKDEFTI
jgi:hypothetical protein